MKRHCPAPLREGRLCDSTNTKKIGQKIALLFQETGQSHRRDKVFHLSLQSRKSITCIALPEKGGGPVCRYQYTPDDDVGRSVSQCDGPHAIGF